MANSGPTLIKENVKDHSELLLRCRFSNFVWDREVEAAKKNSNQLGTILSKFSQSNFLVTTSDVIMKDNIISFVSIKLDFLVKTQCFTCRVRNM